MRIRPLLVVAFALACGPRGGGGDAGRDAVIIGLDTGPCTASGSENTAATCGDGMDNECDGHADCNDFDCCSLVTCDVTTACGRHDGGMCTSGPENTVAACNDGCDNDADGHDDCFDFDCCMFDAPIRTDCPARSACNPSCGTAEMPENTIERCHDACDDDGNHFVDCRDRGCCAVLTAAGMINDCPTNTFCRTDPFPTLCAGDDGTGEAHATTDSPASCMLATACDENRDGLAGCNSPDCCALLTGCADGTRCGDFCGPTEETEDNAGACGDMCDNDHDGHIDCEDFDCAGMGACP